MRFPFGARNQSILQVVTRLGYRSIFWTFDSQDSIGEPKSTKFLFERITKQTDAQLDGQIILMHILNSTTAEALPLIIKNLQERGFGLVTVSKLLE
jgi:peptidoglycan/xylan/chitin deacetylase (PgdA/CDA1 family)